MPNCLQIPSNLSLIGTTSFEDDGIELSTPCQLVLLDAGCCVPLDRLHQAERFNCSSKRSRLPSSESKARAGGNRAELFALTKNTSEQSWQRLNQSGERLRYLPRKVSQIVEKLTDCVSDLLGYRLPR